jgi:4-hydroxy-2-oxoheptanedioate aldolase
MSVESCGQMVRAAELSGLTPLVRVATNEPGTILRYLDTGVMGIIVPHCDTKEAARATVEAVKYPPEGDRGMGGRLQSLSGMTVADYVKEVNKETMVVVMIEDPQGVKNIAEILEVEGIDVFLVGRLDLSVSLGVPGQVEHPRIKEALDKVLTSARKAGKAVGVGAIDVGNPERVRQFIDQGAQLFPLNAISIFGNAAKGLLQGIVKGA